MQDEGIDNTEITPTSATPEGNTTEVAHRGASGGWQVGTTEGSGTGIQEPFVESVCVGSGSEWEPPLFEVEQVPHARKPAPPRWLSPSGATTFNQCSRRWRFKYVERLPDPAGEAALRGKFAHRVLELVMQLPPQNRTPGEAQAVARRCWPEFEADQEYQGLGLDESGGRRFRWKAWKAIEGLWQIEDPEQVEVRSTELDIQTELRGIPFRGVVDRLDNTDDGVVVVDYKSGRMPASGFGDPRLDQVLLYAAAVTETTGRMPVLAQLLYLGQGRIATRVNPMNLNGAVERLAATWKSVNTACDTDEFKPSPGPLCGWCPYVDHCPEGKVEVAERKARRRTARAINVAARTNEIEGGDELDAKSVDGVVAEDRSVPAMVG